MSQEITIIVLVDVPNALKQNKLEGNIYLIDNLRTDGSKGVGSPHLTSAINGSYWVDGSQAYDIIINWLTTGLGSLPPTLPRGFYKQRTEDIEDKIVKQLKSPLLQANASSITQAAQKLASTLSIRDEKGNARDLDIKPLTVTGDLYQPSQDDPSSLSYLMPIISDIKGEAVEKNVLFPCQLGTPVYINNGWYWCATANTAKVGLYSYTMHITLHKLVNGVYEPIVMTYDAKINVTTKPQVNGFTQAGMGFIPL
jgi:hypothetical protein